MRQIEMDCDKVRLRFTISVDDREVVIEDVELADKEAVMSDPDFWQDLQDGHDMEMYDKIVAPEPISIRPNKLTCKEAM